jgi:hypothetical protein
MNASYGVRFFIANKYNGGKNMLDYESFKKKVLKEFLSYLPERYSDCTLEIRRVPKINHCLTGVVIRPKETKGSFCSPTFYMERMYEQYKNCGSFEQVMSDQAVYLEESLKMLPEDVMKYDFESMKSRIIFQVVNTEHNREMIAQCPHRNIMDLTVVYRVVLSVDEDGVSGYLITNDIARLENKTEEELYELAMKNTKKIFPFKSERIEQTMSRLMKKWGASDESIETSFKDTDKIPKKERVYVISNKYEFFGANALLYKDVIGKVVKSIGTDCYVLPSSVHDLVVLSTDVFSETDKLADLVRETNNEHVRVSDRLSDSIYLYSIVDGSLNRIVPEEEVS